MASTPPFKAKDSLDALQQLVDDVLVQTGKALRLSCKDGAGNAPTFNAAHQPRLPDTIRAFHNTLNELEYEISDAMATLSRDLNQLMARKATRDTSEQQRLSSNGPDGDPSPPPIIKDPPVKSEPASKAPFPYMGISLSDDGPPSMEGQDEETRDAMMDDINSRVKTESGIDSSAARTGSSLIASNEVKTTEGHGTAIADDKVHVNDGFTVMQFSLAPHKNETQEQQSVNPNESSFELTSFAPPDNGDNHHGINSNTTGANNLNNLTSLENFLPVTSDGPSQSGTVATQEVQSKHLGESSNINNNELSDSAFADIFPNDGQADGMDFDFSIGDGGMGGDSFDELMNDRDNTFDAPDQPDFDANFFGFDKGEDS
ncbi:hypothetical protein CDD82_2344 [Ophiocordyceps australis]|uniref:Uncharacterized protein n=1 Tax=Ophiocordyceps australis TaxID=1399860 RepID=A0A2C5ZI27_9HYPO|nr:hypothetical protein CDD82_2344 [Ophiocordyceps australis]